QVGFGVAFNKALFREAFGRETFECPGDGFRLGLHFGRDPAGGVFDGADGVLGGDEDGEYKRDRGQQSSHGRLLFRGCFYGTGSTARKARPLEIASSGWSLRVVQPVEGGQQSLA